MPESVYERALKRAPVFQHIAGRIMQEFPQLRHESQYRSDSPVLVACAYFLISDAYKAVRNNEGSLTDDYKKAAISALAVMSIRPFVPDDQENLSSRVAYLANPIFALAAGNAWVSDRDLTSHYPFDYLKRTYLSLDNVYLPSLGPFIALVNEDEDWRNVEKLSLGRSELTLIDGWVQKFFNLSNHKM